jgi:pimeloyl-ACP methyl ester carboxylesterase
MPSPAPLQGIEHHRIPTNGITLHVVQAGPQDGRPVILLHGFPEFWWGWHHQIPALVQKGFRVLIPDQRGYNLSDKPRGRAAYRIETLAQDIVGLINATGRECASILGHDWGGAVAWWLATYHPDRVDRLAVLNCPHPLVMSRTLMRSPAQILRSWYMFFFGLPWLPEWMLSRTDWTMLGRAMRATARPGTFTDADLLQYRTAWSQPGALEAMLNWYRAALPRLLARSPAGVRVRVPALLLWGAHDAFLGREMVEPTMNLCDRGRVVFLEEATHWLTHEEPEKVNALLIEFLSRSPSDMR